MTNRSRYHDESDNTRGPQESKKPLIDAAIALYKAQCYTEVLYLCERAIQLDHNYTRAYHGKSLALIGLKRCEEAVGVCDLAIELDPLNADLYIARGDALLEIDRCEDAKRSYEQAIKLSHNRFVEARLRSKIFIAEGKHLYLLKRYREALDTLNKVTSMSAEVYVLIGEIFCELGRFYDARKAYEGAIQLDQQYESVYFEKGKHLLANGKRLIELKSYTEALEFFENAILLGPLQNEAYAEQGKCLFELKRYEEALIAFKNATAFGPKSPENDSENKRYISEIERLVYRPSKPATMQKLTQNTDGRYNEDIFRLMVGKRSYDWKKIHERSDIEEDIATEVADPDEYDENYNQHYDLGEIYEEE